MHCLPMRGLSSPKIRTLQPCWEGRMYQGQPRSNPLSSGLALQGCFLFSFKESKIKTFPGRQIKGLPGPLPHISLAQMAMGLGEVKVGQGVTLAGGHTAPQPQSGHLYPHPNHTSCSPGDPQSHPSPAGSSLAEAELHTSSLTLSSHPLTAEPSPNS